MAFFDIENIMFTFAGYQVSYLEFVGLVFGLVSVILSAMANIWSWPLGIVNVSLSFFLFYQVQLYPDMFLQVFFFVTNIMGWWRWLHPKHGEEDKKRELKVSLLSRRGIILLIVISTSGTFLMGKFAQNLHQLAPGVFNRPSAFPYLDSLVMVLSIVATFCMIQKKVECWVLWVLVDIVATSLYFKRELLLYGVLYFVFCFIASYGLYHWTKEYRSYAITHKL